MLSQKIAFKFPKHVLRRPRRQEHIGEPRLLHGPGRGGMRRGPRAQDGGLADVDRLFGSAIVDSGLTRLGQLCEYNSIRVVIDGGYGVANS